MHRVTSLNNKKKRSTSSRKWLMRQLNDPYVALSKTYGYRSRSAFKLIDIDNKFKLFKHNQIVVDLGCAPGGWLQVATQRVSNDLIIGVDLQPIDQLDNVVTIIGDFTEQTTIDAILQTLHNKKVNIVLSDMATASCGISVVDHTRIMLLVKHVLDFCDIAMTTGGCMVAKVLRGGTEGKLLTEIKQKFHKVSHFKPPSSRADSAEMYVIAIGYLQK